MSRRIGSKMVILVCVATVAFCGCRRRHASVGTEGPDFIAPEEIPTEIADETGVMGPRFEEGTRVTDAVFENVLFAFDSANVVPSERAKVTAVAEYMKANPDASTVLEGNCDERGSAEYNMALGERRAMAVRAYLVELGVDPARLQTRSYGEERPVSPGHSESDWVKNRRVEFAVYR